MNIDDREVRQVDDVVTTLLELAAVVLLAVGAGLVATALVGGLYGAGVGLMVVALVLGGVSVVLRRLQREERPT